jgi:phospholipase D1/2
MSTRSRWAAPALVFALIVGVGLLWKYTPLAEAVEPRRLAALLKSFESSAWAPFMALGLFVAAAFAMMPLLLLITATALVFDPLIAIAISMCGSLLSSAGVYGVGAKFFSGGVHRAFGPTVERVRAALHARGVIAIATIRMLPIAPFAVVNLAAGSIRVRFRDFLIGTALGLAPGIIVLSAFGQQVKSLWEQPTAKGLLALAGIVIAWLALSFGLQRLVSRRSG